MGTVKEYWENRALEEIDACLTFFRVFNEVMADLDSEDAACIEDYVEACLSSPYLMALAHIKHREEPDIKVLVEELDED